MGAVVSNEVGEVGEDSHFASLRPAASEMCDGYGVRGPEPVNKNETVGSRD